MHITDARATDYRDLLAMPARLEVEGAGQLAFVYLPGDVADNGLPAQYRLAASQRAGIRRMSITNPPRLHTLQINLLSYD